MFFLQNVLKTTGNVLHLNSVLLQLPVNLDPCRPGQNSAGLTVTSDPWSAYLPGFDVADVDSLVLVQRDGALREEDLHAGGGDVFQRPAQHPAVAGATEDAAAPGTLGALLRRLPLLLLLLLRCFLVLAEREWEEGEKG